MTLAMKNTIRRIQLCIFNSHQCLFINADLQPILALTIHSTPDTFTHTHMMQRKRERKPVATALRAVFIPSTLA